MLTISKSLLSEVYHHGEKTYPDECCGLLLGVYENGNRIAKQVFPAQNLNTERSRDRYELNPKDFMAADRLAEKSGLDIVGIYHSHPDHPSKASETDRQKAHHGYSYLITAIHNGKLFSQNSWILDENGHFQEEEIIEINI